MKAILIGTDKQLIWTDVPDPVMQDDEVLIDIHAAALNRADLMQRAGQYPPPPGCPEWMGLEVSGIVRQVGPVAARNSAWKPGDEVCALLGGGGYAEAVSVRYDMLMPIPDGISLVEAAALPEAFATAYLNLFIEGQAQPGETLLMHAGASGLASVVIPMARSFGLRVITSVLTAEKARSIAHLHADVIIDSSCQRTADVLREQSELGFPVSLAIDCLGSESMGECLPYLARGARWIMIATLAGDLTEINLRTIYTRGIRLIGSTLRSRPPEVKAKILAGLVAKVWPRVTSGDVRPTVYRVLPIQQAEEAHAILERGEHVGKVILTVR
ncbi:MAG: NAD(P)H-quinone oxidoreductase [Clostridiaceae bacterium]|jgi:NADPH2:quinone reductase|nr:NAD(P)H-quinone oxidoreductase [Clostridiaceae bacterium]